MIFTKIKNNRHILREKVAARFCNLVMPRLSRYCAPHGARLRGNGIRAFWWTGEWNFGDLITPMLLRRYGYTPLWAPPADAQVAATGSILGMLDSGYGGLIIGSGLLSDTSSLRFPHAKILALRGVLTRERLGADPSLPLGDPGLLSCDVLGRRPGKRFQLGIVPHYEDLAHPKVREISRRSRGEGVKIINVLRSPVAVIRDIDRCEHIISSSLHGCVVADSLGIPNRWAVISDQVLGKGFKFRDYYSALNIERSPLALTGGERVDALIEQAMVPPDTVAQVQAGLRKVFGAIRAHLVSG